MRHPSFLLFVTVFSLAFAGCATQQVEQPVQSAKFELTDSFTQPVAPFEPSTFMRFIDMGDTRGMLDTAIVSYEHADGTRVTLIGAVHVADPSYYAQLRARFTQYDALLYEMVKPADAPVPAPGNGGSSTSATSFVQRAMTRILALQFQLDGIDYRAENFIHADLTAESFAAMQKEKGESLWSLMMTNMRQHMARRKQAQTEGKPLREMSGSDLLAALMSDDAARELKYLMAQQIEVMEAEVAGALGDSVILVERNKACLDVFSRERAAGKRDLAIFYGAAHMRDLEERLVKDMGFRKDKQEWLTAWTIQAKQ